MELLFLSTPHTPDPGWVSALSYNLCFMEGSIALSRALYSLQTPPVHSLPLPRVVKPESEAGLHQFRSQTLPKALLLRILVPVIQLAILERYKSATVMFPWTDFTKQSQEQLSSYLCLREIIMCLLPVSGPQSPHCLCCPSVTTATTGTDPEQMV